MSKKKYFVGPIESDDPFVAWTTLRFVLAQKKKKEKKKRRRRRHFFVAMQKKKLNIPPFFFAHRNASAHKHVMRDSILNETTGDAETAIEQ